jgi:hypothetical protein
LRTGHFIQLILHDTKHKINIYGKPATQGLEISQRTTGIGCTTGIDIVSPFTASLDRRYGGIVSAPCSDTVFKFSKHTGLVVYAEVEHEKCYLRLTSIHIYTST